MYYRQVLPQHLILLFFFCPRSSKSLPTLDDNRITLQCLENYMLLKMDLQDLPIIEPTSLHLRHFSCRPQVINTSALFRVPFRGCGTTLGIELDHIVYQNVVDNSQKMNGSRMAVRHAPELYYPFVCRYRQKYIVTLKEGRGTDQNSKTGRENRNQTTEDIPKVVSNSSSNTSPWMHNVTWLTIIFELMWTLLRIVH
ncbi:uncharacterized protein [Pocillopora verrucosa]|uniref:ZP domain-containing protein n=1 Tax=Pocillopora damicornis TaxID=46731 RepID=A0A3M6U760_POCDA|nr:uncharacterized protein LOC113667868 isoform X1 [Pocillopora damicornis]XP_058944771.1 uncharacterized protein LOC131772831 isoform X1 [Pocillopora verrucosa]RMX49513.1 hypothetical protein pdam_00019472 [Pocillopora damicornis]